MNRIKCFKIVLLKLKLIEWFVTIDYKVNRVQTNRKSSVTPKTNTLTVQHKKSLNSGSGVPQTARIVRASSDDSREYYN